jgi:L-idonate 5-dehydrogenase
MRACVIHGGSDLRVEELRERPPRAGEIAVAVGLGGICGSDLHYWRHGRVGDFVVVEPMVLGHEVVGTVDALGPGTTGPEAGTPVTVHPATTCGRCPSCRAGRRNLCADVRYLGSAARIPHVQGGFCERLVVPADQVVPLPEGLAPRRAVLAEPLAVAVHALRRAGEVFGRRVLITGSGPIGCLTAAAARAAGAAEVVVTDLLAAPLEVARAVGATRTVLVSDAPAVTDADVVIEASGSPAAVAGALHAVRRGGTVVLVGLPPAGDVPFPGTVAVTREIDVRGTFRFDTEFTTALDLLARGLPVDAVVTHTLPLDRAAEGFALAADRNVASKVLLDLTV